MLYSKIELQNFKKELLTIAQVTSLSTILDQRKIGTLQCNWELLFNSKFADGFVGDGFIDRFTKQHDIKIICDCNVPSSFHLLFNLDILKTLVSL